MSEKSSQPTVDQPKHSPVNTWLRVVKEQVEAINFGSVENTVHDSKVVQVQRTEKLRLDPTR